MQPSGRGAGADHGVRVYPSGTFRMVEADAQFSTMYRPAKCGATARVHADDDGTRFPQRVVQSCVANLD